MSKQFTMSTDSIHSSQYISINDSTGNEVWKGTPEMWGYFLAAMRGDIRKEWRCNRNFGCDPESVESGHETCCWIVYYEVRVANS